MDENMQNFPVEEENNENLVEETQENVQETAQVQEEVEEAVEAAVETEVTEAEEAVEETEVTEEAQVAEETEEAEATEEVEVAEEAEEVFEEVLQTPKKKSPVGIVIGIIVAVAILAAAAVFAVKYFTSNPYNRMGYINISGRTISDIAQEAGITVDEFLAQYSLPADMPEDTEEAAAYYTIPVSKIAQMYGMEYAELKERFGLGDEITENTTWGEAESKIKLKVYVGENMLEQFKQEYGLGDEVTGETTWGEIRNQVETLELERRQQEAAAQNASQESAQEPTQTETDGQEEAQTQE